MIKVEETKSWTTGVDTRKSACCPACGRRYTFYCLAPDYCERCDAELPDLVEMVESSFPSVTQARRLEYHITGKTKRMFT